LAADKFLCIKSSLQVQFCCAFLGDYTTTNEALSPIK
jgi:hypothetical protein